MLNQVMLTGVVTKIVKHRVTITTGEDINVEVLFKSTNDINVNDFIALKGALRTLASGDMVIDVIEFKVDDSSPTSFRGSLNILLKAVDALYADGWKLDRIVNHDDDKAHFRSVQYYLTKGDILLDILSILHADNEWIVEAASHNENNKLDVFYVYDESYIPELVEYYKGGD